MPSLMIHLKTAFNIKESLGVSNAGNFYLGAVAPDYVNLNGFADREKRFALHIKSEDIDVWKKNVKDFCSFRRSKIAENDEFILGFITHLYTDIVWDELYQPLIIDFLKESNIPESKLWEERWKLIYGYDKSQLEYNWWQNDVRRKMESGGKGTVFEKELSGFRDKILSGDVFINKVVPRQDCGFINDGMIESLSQNVLTLIKENNT